MVLVNNTICNVLPFVLSKSVWVASNTIWRFQVPTTISDFTIVLRSYGQPLSFFSKFKIQYTFSWSLSYHSDVMHRRADTWWQLVYLFIINWQPPNPIICHEVFHFVAARNTFLSFLITESTSATAGSNISSNITNRLLAPI